MNSTSIIDNLTKIVSSLVLAGGFIWGIMEFQHRQHFNETNELRMKLWEKKLETYSKLQNISGEIIINRNEEAKLDSLQLEFDRLYYSTMILVEDTLVEAKVIKYREALNDFQEGVKGEQYLKAKQIEMIKELSSSLKKRQELLFDEKPLF